MIVLQLIYDTEHLELVQSPQIKAQILKTAPLP